MFTVHHLTDSRSQRIVWLLELIGVAYEIKAYGRDQKTHLTPESYKKLHPLAAAPVLEHNGFLLAESGAICEYVIQQCAEESSFLLPARDSKAYIDVQFWSHFAEGSFMPPLVASLVLSKVKTKVPWLIKGIASKITNGIMDAYYGKVIKRNFAYVEAHLSANLWFVGDEISLADIHMSYGLERIYNSGMIKDYPNMCAYVERLNNESTYEQAKNKIKLAESAL
ncbi:glutathione S-transferase family protein [Agaribacter flavus]|uniref:Glutathione S-transferase family protein n=1 Tax=Agaribacter flavus TaxID=1902781 RepID=A0ABV7FTB4_9ALTE